MNLKPVVIPISQVKVDTVSIPQGVTSYNLNSLFSGELPNTVVVGLVDNQAYTGSLSKNPFHFQHVDLNYIQLKVNDRLIPTSAMTPNYGEIKWMAGYRSLFDVVGRKNQNWSNSLDQKDYLEGSTLYGFVINEDRLCRHDSANLRGHIDIAMRFGKVLPQTMTLIVYSSTQANVIIDKHRNVLLSGT